MFIAKDLLLIFFLLIFVIKYIILYNHAVKQRNYFIDTLSHDLRVSAIAQIRALEILKKQKKEELINDIHQASLFSLDMINMLLNTFKYENKEEVLNYESVNLKEIVYNTEIFLSDLAAQKEIDLVNNIDSNTLIDADKEALYKVISILMATAINNAKRKSSINLILEKLSQEYKISIFYQGKALTEEECKRMFSQKTIYSTVGQGIKLQLCKKIIDFHNGKISIKNCGGNLNTFTFSVPINNKTQMAKTLFLSAIQTSKFL